MLSNSDLVKIQTRLFEMAKIVSGILEHHNIPYMIAFGTLLGAVRHKGFIPWDDDFDFFIFDDIYDDAVECLRSKMPGSLFLEDEKSEPLFFHAWAHVKDINSEVSYDKFPQDNYYSHKGISLDLYRIKRMKKNEVMLFINDENRSYINRRKDKSLISREEYERRMQMLELDEKKAENLIDNDQTEVFAFPTPYKRKFIYASDVWPLKKYQFEDTEFFGPANAEKILRDIYGDFMQFPPLEERIPHCSSVKFLNDD